MNSPCDDKSAHSPAYRSLYFLAAILVMATVVACSPEPTPVPTRSAPTVAPTANAKATEAVIIAHVFGTMTASAPTPIPPPAATPTLAPKPTTAAPRVTARPAVTATAAPVAPKPTTVSDPYLAQIPAGKGGILLINYYGNSAFFTIAGSAYEKFEVPGSSKALVVMPPGTYAFSLQVPGTGGASWNGTIQVPEGQYVKYEILPR